MFDERGIPETTQRDGTPNGHHVLEVEGTSVRMRYQAAGAPATEQMRILCDVAHHGLSPDVLRQFRPGELHDGRIAFKIPPWIANRRKLVREIQKRIREAGSSVPD